MRTCCTRIKAGEEEMSLQCTLLIFQQMRRIGASQRKSEKQMKLGVLIWSKTNLLVGDILTSRGQPFC